MLESSFWSRGRKTNPIKISLRIFTAPHYRCNGNVMSPTTTVHLPPFYKFSADGPHTCSWQDIPIKYTELQFELRLFQLPDHLLDKLKVFLTVADEGIKHLCSAPWNHSQWSCHLLQMKVIPAVNFYELPQTLTQNRELWQTSSGPIREGNLTFYQPRSPSAPAPAHNRADRR